VAAGFIASPAYEGSMAVWPDGTYPHRVRIDFQVVADSVPLEMLGERNWQALRRGGNGAPGRGDEAWNAATFTQLIADLQSMGEALSPSTWRDPSQGDRGRYQGRNLDRQTVITTRAESFRGDLLGDRQRHPCALCGRELPVRLLWASHIKKRSACSPVEKSDPNIVMANCLLGCDTLYERGVVRVDADGVIQLGNLLALPGFSPPEVEALVREIGVRIGENCPVFSAANAGYFAWHFGLSQIPHG
jgi:hypothetical protein